MRIKTNIQPVASMLDTINKIEIVSFDFIDPISHKRDECGVIAQQLKTVFPNAVDTSKGIIPCFMTKEKRHYIQDNNVVILFDMKDQVVVGDTLKIVTGIYSNTQETTEDHGTYMIKVIGLVDGGIICEKWDKYQDTEIVIYGKEVDDFHNVDKEQLGVMALKGVQELHSIIKTQQDIITVLQEKLDANTTLLTKITSKLNIQ
jgi:hypothetical protein